MTADNARIGQRVYRADDGMEFIIIGFDEEGATIKNGIEITWCAFCNLFQMRE